MAFTKVEEARTLSNEELAEQIVAVKRQLVDLKLLKATGRLEKPHQFKHIRHRLAQLLTVECERERAARTSEKTAPSPSVQTETSKAAAS